LVSSSPMAGVKLPKVASAPIFLAPTLCAISLSILDGANPSTIISPSFFVTQQKIWLIVSRSPAQWFPRRFSRLSSHSSDIAAFKTSILIPLMLSGFGLHFFLNTCPLGVPHTTLPVPCPSRYHCPGSISSADCGTLWLDTGPHTTPSVLQKIPLWPLP
jgi:hypothetical protein